MEKEVEQKISLILERNKQVESGKAWETSKARRALLAAATYIVV